MSFPFGSITLSSWNFKLSPSSSLVANSNPSIFYQWLNVGLNFAVPYVSVF